MIYKYIFLILIILIKSTNFSNSIENKILLKVDNEIITTIDISNEINYLSALNNSVKQLDKNSVIGIAKNSLIKDKIKQIELNKSLSKLNIDENHFNLVLKNTYSKIGFNNIDNFINHLNNHNVKIDKVKKKLF